MPTPLWGKNYLLDTGRIYGWHNADYLPPECTPERIASSPHADSHSRTQARCTTATIDVNLIRHRQIWRISAYINPFWQIGLTRYFCVPFLSATVVSEKLFAAEDWSRTSRDGFLSKTQGKIMLEILYLFSFNSIKIQISWVVCKKQKWKI